jgi:hypothetical protein
MGRLPTPRKKQPNRSDAGPPALEYRARIAAMSVSERVRRAEALFNWSRDCLARSILEARGPMSDRDLRCEIALRQYGADPAARQLIDELRTRASGNLENLLDEVLGERDGIDL